MDCRCEAPSLPGGSRMALGNLKMADFCQKMEKSLAWHTFFTMEGGDSEFAKFTVPTLRAFSKACSQNVSGNKQ